MVLKSQFSHPHRPRSPASPPTSKTGFKQISCDLSLILLEINAYATFFRDVKFSSLRAHQWNMDIGIQLETRATLQHEYHRATLQNECRYSNLNLNLTPLVSETCYFRIRNVPKRPQREYFHFRHENSERISHNPYRGSFCDFQTRSSCRVVGFYQRTTDNVQVCTEIQFAEKIENHIVHIFCYNGIHDCERWPNYQNVLRKACTRDPLEYVIAHDGLLYLPR